MASQPLRKNFEIGDWSFERARLSAAPLQNSDAGRFSANCSTVPFQNFDAKSSPQALKSNFWLETAGLGFLEIKPQLPKLGGFAGIYTRLQVGFFHKVSPTGTSVFLALAPFIVIESFLRALRIFDHGHNAARDVRLLVEADNRKRMLRVVSHFNFPI